MAAITFPSSPYTNQIYTVGSKSWQWDGSVWASYYNETPDSIYGTGIDGDASLTTTAGGLGTYSSWSSYSSSVFSLTRDVFLNDVTLDTNIRLQPNGYRIFIKGVLKFSSGAAIGYTSGYSTAGSIQQGGATSGGVGTSVSCSLGGSAAATYTATAPTAAQGGTQYWYQPRQAILGYVINASNTTPVFLRGGAGGTTQAGGGVVILAARYISGPATGTASIKAPATSPGGGGAILIVSSASALPASITTDVTGANAGTVVYMQLV